MATALHKPARFELTQRIRSEMKYSGEAGTKFALIDRLAELPGIETIAHRDDSVPSQVDVYLRRDRSGSQRDQQPALLFCSISHEGISISGLDQWAMHQIVSRGWGRIALEDVLVPLPRNRRELDTVWKIVQRAFSNLFTPSVNVPGAQIVSTWDWPKYSRTTLQ